MNDDIYMNDDTYMNDKIQLSLNEKIEKESLIIEEKLRHSTLLNNGRTETEIEEAFLAETTKLGQYFTKKAP